MRSLIFILAICSFFQLSCKQSGTKTNESGVYSTKNADQQSDVKLVPASVLAPLIGKWEVELTAGITKKADRDLYQGRWFALTGDQTFICGIYDKATNQGTYEFAEETNLIDFYFETPEVGVASQYEIQGIGVNDSSVLIWKGNTPKNKKGMQLKMAKVEDPTVQ